MSCSSPRTAPSIEGRHTRRQGLLAGGGASRGNLLLGRRRARHPHGQPHGGREHANPGYRAVPRQRLQRDALAGSVRLGGRHRDGRGGEGSGGATCGRAVTAAALPVPARDAVRHRARPDRVRRLSDMMRGRPAVYATFSSYDEVAHHSGLEREDTLEALRKLDQQFARIERARRIRAAARTRSSCSPTTARRRARPSSSATATAWTSSSSATCARAASSPTRGRRREERVVGTPSPRRPAGEGEAGEERRGERAVVVLGSGNLGLVYLMEEPRRLTLEEIEARHPRLVPALRAHPHVGWLLVHSAEHGAVVLGAGGANYLDEDRVEGEDPLAGVLAYAPRASAAHGRLRARRGHAGQQLLRPRARRGLRVRGADLVPRRARRLADPAVPAPSGAACRCRPSRSSAPRRRTTCLPDGGGLSRTIRRRPVESRRAGQAIFR